MKSLVNNYSYYLQVLLTDVNPCRCKGPANPKGILPLRVVSGLYRFMSVYMPVL